MNKSSIKNRKMGKSLLAMAVACAAMLAPAGIAEAASVTGFSSGWQANGNASINTTTNVLTLTTAAGQASSAWYTTPVSVATSYSLSFTYTESPTSGAADGFTVGFESGNNSNPTTKVGRGGGDLGWAGIANTLAWGESIYNNTVDTGTLMSNGNVGSQAAPTNSLSIYGTVNFVMNYSAATSTLTVQMTDASSHVENETFTGVNYGTGMATGGVNPTTMYLGFTGGSGGVGSTQQISNLSFASPPVPVGPTWALADGGSWNTASNWGGSVPNGTEAVANFASNPTAAATVTLDDGNGSAANVTLNVLNFVNVNAVTIATGAGGSLTFDGATPSINVMSGTGHTISAPMLLNASTSVLASSGTNVTLSGGIGDGSNGAQGLTLGGTAGPGTVYLGGVNTYSGATTIAGGTTNLTGTLGNSAVNVTGGVLSLQSAGAVSQNTITVSGTGALTQSAANGISGSTALAVTGGTATLSQLNNYSGGTVVTGGKLLITSTDSSGVAAGSGGVVINSGGTLGGSGTLNAATINTGGSVAPHLASKGTNTLTIGALTVNDGGSFTFNLGPSGNDQVIAGTLNLSGVETFNVAFPNGLASGTYSLLGYTGSFTAPSAVNIVGTSAESYSLTAPNTGSNFTNYYVLQTQILTATWNLAGNGTWDATSPNWTVAGGGTTYSEGMPVVFDDSSTGTASTVSIIGAGVNPNSVTFNNSTAKSYTVSNASGNIGIAGSTGVTLSGTGTVTFSSANTYTGATNVNSGTLIVSGALTATSAINIASGGTLQIGNNGTTGSIPSGVAVTDNGNLVISRSGGNFLNNSATQLNYVISGTGNVIMNGTGNVQLTGANSYSGNTYVNAGILAFHDAANLGSTTSGNIYIGDTSGSANAALAVAWDNANPSLSVNKALIVRSGSTGTASLGAPGSGRWNLTINGPVTLNKSLTVFNSGEQSSTTTTFTNATLTGVGGIIHTASNNAGQSSGYYPIMYYTPATSPDFQGGTTANGGLIQWTRSAATAVGGDSISFGTGDITLNGTTRNVLSVSSYMLGGDFELYDTQSGTVNNAPVTLSNNIHVIGQGGGGLYGWQSGGANMPNIIFSGKIDLAGALRIGSRSAGGGGNPIQYTGTVAINQASAGARSIQYNVAGNYNIWGNQAVTLSNTAVLTGDIVDGTGIAGGSYANPLAIRGGTVNFAVQGLANTYAGGTFIESNGITKWQNSAQVLNSSLVTVNASSSLGTGSVVVAPNAALKLLNTTTNVASGKQVYVGGSSSALGVLSLGQDTANVANLVASGSNGILALDSTSFTNDLNMANMGNGNMRLGAVGTGTTFSGTLSPSGTMYRLGGGGGTLTISSALTGAGDSVEVGAGGGVRYNGTGTIILSNANTYGGSTTVNPGSTLQGVAQTSGTPFGSSTTAVNLNGGGLTLVGASSDTSTNIGAVTVTGYGKIGVIAGASGNTVLNAASVNVDPASPGSNVLLIDSSVNGTTAQFAVAGMATATVLPGNFISTPNTGLNNVAANFASYDAVAGFAAFTGYTATSTQAAWTALNAGNISTLVVNNTAPVQLVAGTSAISMYGLKVSSNGQGNGNPFGAVDLNGNSLSIGAGGIIFTSDDGSQPAGPAIKGNVAFGSNPGYIYTGVVPSGNWSFYTDRNPNISGTLTGSNGLTITGPGNFTRMGANGFSGITGTITVHGATLTVDGSLANTDTSTYAFDNATLQPSGSNNPLTFNGNMTLNKGGLVLNANLGGQGGGTITLAGQLTGVGSLTLNPLYEEILISGTAGNNYSGGTVIGAAYIDTQYNQGYVQVASGSSLGSGDLSVVGPTVVTLLGAGNLASTAEVNLVSNSTLNLQYAGPWTLGNIEGGGNIVLGAGTGSGSTTFTIGDSSNGFFYGSIASVSGYTVALVKNGSGTTTLRGSSTFTGGTTINAGALNIASMANIGSGALSINGGALQFGANFDPFVGGRTTLSSLGGGLDTNGINVTLTNPITGGGSIGLTKAGAGTLTVASVNTYTGGTTVTGGLLSVSGDAALGSSGSPIILNGGGLQLAAVYDPTATRSVTLGASGGTIDTDGNDIALSNVLGGSGSLTKAGAGQLTVLNLQSSDSVTGGILKLTAGSSAHTLETLSSLAISGGSLDITNHDILVTGEASSLAVLRGKVTTSVVGPNNGSGTTTLAIAMVSGSEYIALDKTGNLLDGTTVTSNDLVGVMTYAGDANLDGTITVDDYMALNLGYLFHLKGWTHGDFAQTGTITAADYAIIDNNYLHQSGTVADGEIALHTQWFGAAYTDAFNALNAPAAVPEPASLALLGLGAVALLRRKK